MTPTERLLGAREKVTRAKHHIDDLIQALNRFRDTKPYDIKTEDNPETRQYVKRVVKADPIPPDIPVIVGDILFNLRSALDHIAYQLVLVASPNNSLSAAESRGIYFPLVAKDAANFVSICNAQIHGARQDAKDHIRRIEPYRGGKGEILWKLHELNLADKHRLLLTTVVVAHNAVITTGNVFQTAHKSLGLPLIWAVRLAQRRGPIGFGQFTVTSNEHIQPGRPLKLGDVLMAGSIDRHVYERVDFILQVALSEPGIVEGKPVLETLKQMVDFVDGIVPTFEQFLV